MKSCLCCLGLGLLMGGALHAAPKPLFKSHIVTTESIGHEVVVDVDLKGRKELFLVVTDGGNGIACDWADWVDPVLVMEDGSQRALTDITWKKAVADYGKIQVNRNVGGQAMRVAGKAIERGLGTHSNSVIAFDLPARVARFKARGALDEGGTRQQDGTASSVEFVVYGEDPGPVAVSNAVASREPAAAVSALNTHPELVAQLFASEPMVLSPASIDVDARGRVWVCEVVNYRKHNGERPEGDRILILEDTDGDAKADKSTVFHQGRDVDSAHGICVLGNRVLISCGDEVFWLVDENGDDKADRKEVLFTQIGGAQHDHGIHAFHFGPDGRLYFNFGNAGKQLCDKNGKLITDIHGVKCTNQNNRPYQEGMVFRCELDGSNVEVLAWNFRNNWEVAVDSFGTMWQSDNDDDGNKGVRINYVMEFGNFGYKDEMTSAGWQTPRINLEKEIPRRHWHQNDPGVIPNVLVTGAGSPTGMQVYEGDLLPSIFHGQPIHCDAGPNVVRAYITQPDGAGYKAEIVNILEGARDRWFRPSDVAVAPDGSLMVADWYDPGVGGHGMGDTARGRIFRVTTAAAEKYAVRIGAKVGMSIEQAVVALKSPNEEQRYLAWVALTAAGDKAVPALKALFENREESPRQRARALWVLAKVGDDATARQTLDTALADPEPNLRVTGIRAAHQLWQAKAPARLLECLAKAAGDSSPAVRRECALALRFDGSQEASIVWKKLAFATDGGDRWVTEALGIGADLFMGARLKQANRKDDGDPVPSPGMLREMILRARDEKIPGIIADALVSGPNSDGKDWTGLVAANPGRALRAIQLLQSRHPAEVSRAAAEVFAKGKPEAALMATALLSRDQIAKDPQGKSRLDELLKPVMGKPEFVSLVERLSLTGFEKELLEFILANPAAPESAQAARLIAANRDGAVSFIRKADSGQARSLVGALGRVNDRASVAVLNVQFPAEKRLEVQRAMIDALALSSEGSRAILKWNLEGKLPAVLKDQAALVLSRSTDAGIREQASRELPLPAAMGVQNFPPLADLMKLKGDAAKGQASYLAAGCVACHRVKGQFIDFGPDLSQIGSKLSADGLFAAILYPSAAIEHSYNGIQVTTKEGLNLVGYIISETDADLTLKMAGGATQTVKKAEITKREELTQSLMPPGLAGTLGPQGLADLVAYLQTLK